MSSVTETQIQQTFFAWARAYPLKKLRWIHAIPNGGKRSVTAAQRAVAEGLTRGIADVFLPCARGKYHGLYLEFKTPKGRQTPNQKEFEEWCIDNDYQYTVVRNLETAIDHTLSYLSLR